MRILPLANHVCDQLQHALQRLGKEHGLTNIFNPSIAFVGAQWHLTFRAETFFGEKPFRAFYTYLVGDRFAAPIDISVMLGVKGLAQIADPKLVKLGEELFFTFNTGNQGQVENSIFLMRMWPTVGHPQRCDVSDRQTVEKNWAFFIDQQGLGAIYSLSPVVRLRLVNGTLGNDEVLHFQRSGDANHQTVMKNSMTIGTQLSFQSRNVAYMVVHEKPHLLGRRGYIGRIAKIHFESGGKIDITLAQVRLIHSIRKLFHFGKRHNPNLLWAVYFSGLAIHNDKLIFSYGINDVEFGFAALQLDIAWL